VNQLLSPQFKAGFESYLFPQGGAPFMGVLTDCHSEKKRERPSIANSGSSTYPPW